MSFSLLALKDLSYFAFQYLDYDRTWWWLFQKLAVRTKLDINIFYYF
jgi:hypothetical protein